MAIQLQATRHKRTRVLMKDVSTEDLVKYAADTSAGAGKRRLKAINELSRRGEWCN